MDESGNAVVGVVDRGRLSGALTAIHRGGHGHNARVLDATRGDVVGQLRRAGVTDDLGIDPRAKDLVLILVHAPGRTARVAELLQRVGAQSVQVVNRVGAETPATIAAGVLGHGKGRRAEPGDQIGD